MPKAYEYILKINDSQAKSSVKDFAKDIGAVENKLAKLGKSAGLDEMTRGLKNSQLSVGSLQGKIERLTARRDWTTSRNKIAQYNSEIRKAQKEVDKLSGKQSSAFSGLGGQLTALIGVGAGIGIAKSIATAGIEMEKTRVSFTTFLGSASSANAVISDLNKFSNVTPFNNEQVLSAGKSLLAFGVTTESLIPSLKAIGDISAGTGKDFNELTTIYGKAKVAGTLYAEDINQLVEAGVPIIGEFAKQLGVGEDQVKKMASQGKISFSMLEKGFQNLTGEGGKFNNLMDKQSQTVGGRISTVIGNLQLLGAKIGEALLPAIGFVVDLTGALIANEGLLKSIGVVVGIGTAAFLAYQAVVVIAGIQTSLLTAKEWLLNIALNANPVGLVIAGFLALIGVTILAWNKFEGFRGAVFGVWEVLKEVYNNIVTKFKELPGVIWEAIKGIPKAFINAFKDVGGIIKAVLTGDFKAIPDLLKSAGTNLLKSNPMTAVGLAVGGKLAEGTSEAWARGMKKGADKSNQLAMPSALTGGASAGGDFSTSSSTATTQDGTDQIAGKGGRQINVTVNLGKFLDNIVIQPTTMSEGVSDIENQMKEMFIRLLNGGLHAATQ